VQTNFTQSQLDDPALAEANRIFRNCVHCGFCTATCPSYVLLGDELDSPRGRIYLIKDLLEHGRPANARFTKHIDRCLSCLACMTTCPSGVQYQRLVDHARVHIEQTFKRPLLDRAVRALLAAVVPYPARFRLMLVAASLARPLARILPGRPGAMLGLAPKTLLPPRAEDRMSVFPAEGRRKGRVALLAGCAQRVLAPDINAATIRLLNRHGVEVVIPPDAGCCGALVGHMGREDEGRAQAVANIVAWLDEADGEGLDAIIVNASGCGTTVKDYGHLLQDDPALADSAARVSALARDISEYLTEIELQKPVRITDITVAYQSPCSLQHGQQVTTIPVTLLEQFGFRVAQPAEPHLCCGSAGTYNMLQPKLANQLRERKAANLARLAPAVVASGNIGCMTQLAPAMDIPVVHTVELLDWATGGPKPPAMAERGG
jgi:glycolate oxidase iron-sulfur subunit